MPTQILSFWFGELGPHQWFSKDPVLDAHMRERFLELHTCCMAGELAAWRQTPQGALAEVILLDQFSRNMFRDTPAAFASDPLALALAQQALERGFQHQLSPVEHGFLLMPFMHSESRLIHRQALTLFEQLGDPSRLYYEQLHKAIIDRFGRYPHRNAVLGRISTAEELEFLQQPGSSF